MIQMYYDKWWKSHGKQQRSTNFCKTRKTVNQKAMMANALGVVNIGGIFVVLLCGLAVAIIVAIVEFCWSSQSKPHRHDLLDRTAEFKSTSLCAEMWTVVKPTGKKANKSALAASRSTCSSCSLARAEQTDL